MKISELIQVLQRRMEKHGDIEVEITWEGITVDIGSDLIYKSKDGLLLIDADGNRYKSQFAVDPAEGEDEQS